MVIYTADSSQVKEDQTMTVGGGRTQNVIIYLGSNIRGQILNNIQVQRSNIQGQIVNNKLMSIASSEQDTQVQIFIYRTKKNNSMMRKLFALEYGISMIIIHMYSILNICIIPGNVNHM